jgi:hypothetical protein
VLQAAALLLLLLLMLCLVPLLLLLLVGPLLRCHIRWQLWLLQLQHQLPGKGWSPGRPGPLAHPALL